MKRKILFILLFLLCGQPLQAQLPLEKTGKSSPERAPITLFPPAITHKCVETDLGQNLNLPGVTTYRRLSGKKILETETGQDRCESDGIVGEQLVEYYCEGNRMKSIKGYCERGCLNGYCKECNSNGNCPEGEKCNATKQCEAEPYCVRLEGPGRVVNGKRSDDSALLPVMYDRCFDKYILLEYECAPNGEAIRNFTSCPPDQRCGEETRDGHRIGTCR